MRVRGCVAEAEIAGGGEAKSGDWVSHGAKRNAERILHVCLGTGRIAISETIDARRGILEV